MNNEIKKIIHFFANSNEDNIFVNEFVEKYPQGDSGYMINYKIYKGSNENKIPSQKWHLLVSYLCLRLKKVDKEFSISKKNYLSEFKNEYNNNFNINNDKNIAYFETFEMLASKIFKDDFYEKIFLKPTFYNRINCPELLLWMIESSIDNHPDLYNREEIRKKMEKEITDKIKEECDKKEKKVVRKSVLAIAKKYTNLIEETINSL